MVAAFKPLDVDYEPHAHKEICECSLENEKISNSTTNHRMFEHGFVQMPLVLINNSRASCSGWVEGAALDRVRC